MQWRAAEVRHVADQLVEIDVFDRSVALAGIRKHSVDKVRGPLRTQRDRADAVAHSARRLDLHGQQVSVADDTGKQVVEVVRQAACEDGEALALLLLQDADLEHGTVGLGAKLIRNISRDDNPGGSALVPHVHANDANVLVARSTSVDFMRHPGRRIVPDVESHGVQERQRHAH